MPWAGVLGHRHLRGKIQALLEPGTEDGLGGGVDSLPWQMAEGQDQAEPLWRQGLQAAWRTLPGSNLGSSVCLMPPGSTQGRTPQIKTWPRG